MIWMLNYDARCFIVKVFRCRGNASACRNALCKQCAPVAWAYISKYIWLSFFPRRAGCFLKQFKMKTRSKGDVQGGVQKRPIQVLLWAGSSCVMLLLVAYLLHGISALSSTQNRRAMSVKFSFAKSATQARAGPLDSAGPCNSTGMQHSTRDPLQILDTDTTSAEQAAVDYLTQHVLTSRPHRQPVENHMLPQAGADDKDVSEYRSRVMSYLQSREFKQRWHELQAQDTDQRGIVISTGGKYYLPKALVLLRVLRYSVNCTLPVELFWVDDGTEMDPVTFKALQEEFGPLYGHSVSKRQHAWHHWPRATLKSFPMKAWALLYSRFKEVLLLDSDIVPMRDPAYMFDAPEYKERGNLFWYDYWDYWVKQSVYGYLGLDRRVHEELQRGKADFIRDSETGQLLINRAQHLDVLEWVWYLNAFGKDRVYKFMWGDKDTFAVAFAMAGKAHMFQHVNVPPGGIWAHRDTLSKQTDQGSMNRTGNWHVNAFTQYNPQGELLFVHRTMNKADLQRTPLDELITPPLPIQWVLWHMAYGAPKDRLHTSLNIMNYNITHLLNSAAPGQLCPLAAWAAYWTMRTHAIPVDRNRTMEAACSSVLDVQYGRPAAAIIRAKLMEHPARLTINKLWDTKINGGYKAPELMLAVPLNMTAAYSTWLNLDAASKWAREWVKGKPILSRRL